MKNSERQEKLLKQIATRVQIDGDETTVNREEAAAYLSVSIRTLENRQQEGVLSPCTGGGKRRPIRYRLSDLRKLQTS